MFFERRCPVCGRSHRTLCVPCVDSLELLDGDLSVPGLDGVTSLFSYDDASARLILAAKNGGRRDLLRWSGAHLGRGLASRRLPIHVVTWVPAHPEQRRTRGYDQGQVLARSVAKALGVRARPTLQRRDGASRKGLGRLDRLEGPEVKPLRAVEGGVLLVDDVMATGSSLERCADVLRSAGANEVFGAVVAASTTKSAALAPRVASTIYIGGSSGNRLQAT